jgi:hypothetical protein
LIERQLRHPEVLGSTLARVVEPLQAAGPLQLGILIDTTGLEDHLLPRNFVPLNTCSDTLSTPTSTPQAGHTDHTRQTVTFSLPVSGCVDFDFLNADVSVPTLSARS